MGIKNNKKILFVDFNGCPPYDHSTLLNSPLGGTEATILRVATGLASHGFDVTIKQNFRTEKYQKYGVNFSSYSESLVDSNDEPAHVILLRNSNMLNCVRSDFPNSKLYFWAHDLFWDDQWQKENFQFIVDAEAIPILVSDWHISQMHEQMQSVAFNGVIQPHRIYNPIDDNLWPEENAIDKEKIVFFSSPHKGLVQSLKVFEEFKKYDELNDIKLYIANPGYFPDLNVSGFSNVVNLGPISHPEVISHVRSAFCVFHLNKVYPETFGLVHVESNAVGTPFIAAAFGATQEITSNSEQFVDVDNMNGVIEKIIDWRKNGRPKVFVDNKFRLQNVLREWQILFNGNVDG